VGQNIKVEAAKKTKFSYSKNGKENKEIFKVNNSLEIKA
jgi:hypothetical protein